MTDRAHEPAGGRRALVVWLTAVGVYFLAIFHRSSLGVAGIAAAERFDISAAQLSTFTVLQLGVYAAMQIPVGVLIDRYGPKRLLFTGAVLMTVAQLGFAFTTTYVTFAIAAGWALSTGILEERRGAPRGCWDDADARADRCWLLQRASVAAPGARGRVHR